MNAARQISRRVGRATEARTRSAADYSITATISVVPDPLKPAVYKVKGNEFFENVPDTGDEKYETGEPWSKYWEDVTGETWPAKCQRVGCACEGKGDAVGGHVWLSFGVLDPYHMWIAPICQHTNKQGEDRRFRLNSGTLLAQVNLRYVVKKSE